MTDATAISSMMGAQAVDFGTWDVDEIQVCKMGSYGPEGEYVRCGGCSLVDGVI
jgi:hypothetical protein